MLEFCRTAGLMLFLMSIFSARLQAADVHVGLLRDNKTLAAGVTVAKSGDRILIDPGMYLDDNATINVPLTIEGLAGGVILRVTKPLANHKGILIVNAALTVRNITFDGARVTDADGKNGAGIRHQSGNLTVESCIFSNNQDGMLINPGASILVTIRRSTFSGNGAGDGYSHGIYANAIGQLTVTDSIFTGTRVGHDIKSRALKTTVMNSMLDDGVTGTPSYAIDLPNGGEVLLQGLTITQGPKTTNGTMIAYGAEGSLHPNSALTVRDSTLVNSAANGIGINNFTAINAILINTAFQGLGTTVKGPSQVSRAAARTVRQGAVYSGTHAETQSYLRFQNTGTSAGNVQLTLFDGTSGKNLIEWTSPSIAPNAAPQFAIADIEKSAKVALPDTYTLRIDPAMTGLFQHVLFRPADGTLTNASSCDAGVQRAPSRLGNVHSSLLAGGFPSTIVIQNTGSAAASAALGVYDARSGAKLGTYMTASIPADGQLLLAMTTVEATAHINPDAGLFHYDVRLENDFMGSLQHLVDNKRVGVMTDMTTTCSLQADPPEDAPDVVRAGGIFSSAQASMQSYLRFYNAGAMAAQVNVTLFDGANGDELSQWTSPMIAPGASPQFAVADMEGVGSKPQFYTASIEGSMKGSVQHVLFRPSDGTLTNLSTCDEGTTGNHGAVANVHSSLLESGYASTVIIYNTGGTTTSAQLTLYDARDGRTLGTYMAGILPPESEIIVPVTALETFAGISPSAGMFHYNIKSDSGFTGILQQLVDNRRAGVLTDMTTVCALNPS